MKKYLLSFFVYLLVLGPVVIHAQVYVDKDATGLNDGTSWENAYTNLQDALTNAAENSEVWLAEGIYTPDTINGDRTARFEWTTNLHLYGGFDGTETSLEERDPATNTTTLSGDLNGDDELGTINNRTDNSYNILYIDFKVTDVAQIDGFTISHGHANGNEIQQNGAGISCFGTPIFKNCRFEENFALNSGGGLYFFPQTEITLLMENCHFENNRAENDFDGGGGLYVNSIFGEGLTLRNCDFVANNGGRGSGMCVVNSNVTLEGCTFLENTNIRQGGGLWYHVENIKGANLTINNCVFDGNHSSFGGGFYGLLFAPNVTLTVSNSIFKNNFNTPNDLNWGQGGSGFCCFYNQPNVQISIDSCNFENNSSTGIAALAITADGNNSEATITNCNFNENTAFYSGAVDLCTYSVVSDSRFVVSGSNFINNTAMSGGGMTFYMFGSAQFIAEDCYFEGNTANIKGGGLWFAVFDPTIEVIARNLQMVNNTANFGSAAVVFRDVNSTIVQQANVTFENCLITENHSNNGTIAIEKTSEVNLVNCTIAENASSALYVDFSTVNLRNNILQNDGFQEYIQSQANANIFSFGGNIVRDTTLNEWLTDCDLQETNVLFAGTGTPLESYQLGESSPAIDWGQEVTLHEETDLAGNPRVTNRIDAGALESNFISDEEACIEVGINSFFSEIEVLEVFPNPAAEFIQLQLPETTDSSFEVSIIDIQGKEVERHPFIPNQSIALRHLSDGVYIIKVVADKKVYMGRFVKQQ